MNSIDAHVPFGWTGELSADSWASADEEIVRVYDDKAGIAVLGPVEAWADEAILDECLFDEQSGIPLLGPVEDEDLVATSSPRRWGGGLLLSKLFPRRVHRCPHAHEMFESIRIDGMYEIVRGARTT